MTKLFYNDTLDEKVILAELDQYRMYDKAFHAGVPRDERPALPNHFDQNLLILLIGSTLHVPIYFCRYFAHRIRMRWLQGLFAIIRIKTDQFSFEPMSCGLHNAYTHLGIAKIARDDIETAIKCLRSSWHIHPCPHTTSFGLLPHLRDALSEYHEAKEEINKYNSMANEFGGIRKIPKQIR